MTRNFKIILSIIILVLGSFIVTILKEEGIMYTGFWIVGTIVLVIWIIPLNNKQNKNIQVFENSKETIQTANTTTLKQKQTDKEILEDLFSKGILTKIEYEIKLTEIEFKEAERIKLEQKELLEKNSQKHIDLYNQELEKRIEPLLLQVEQLKQAGVLSNIESEDKITQIRIQCKSQLDDDIKNKRVFIGKKIETKKRSDLYGVEMMGIARLESNKNETDVIIKNKRTQQIELKTLEEWSELLSTNESDNYWLIID